MGDSSKDILLANGATVSLNGAAYAVGRLETYLGSPDPADRRAAALLRDACLGRPLTGEGTAKLQEMKLLDGDGNVEPVLRQVVLAAVRGDGEALFLTPPTVDRLDRALLDHAVARWVIWTELPPDEARAALTAGNPEETEVALNRILAGQDETWANRTATDRPPATGPSLPPR